MSNITIFSRAEKTDVTGKIVIENVWKELEEAKTGSSFTSDVFHAEDFAFQLQIFLNGDEEERKHKVGAFIINMTDDLVLLTNIYFELKAIPSNSTELLCRASKRRELTELPAGEAAGAMKLITHNGLKEACEEGDDLLLIVKAQLPAREGDKNLVQHRILKSQQDQKAKVLRWRSRQATTRGNHRRFISSKERAFR